MQGDFKLPRTKKYRPHPKPKPTEHQAEPEPQPDFVIDEAELQAPHKPPKQRKVLVAPHKHFIRFWRWWLSLSKNERFAIIGVSLLIFGVFSILWFAFVQPESSPQISISKNAKPKPKAPITVASPLTGVQVAPELANRPVTGIMIENSVYARPQSGLQDAGVVVEAIAEGGITRFMALFQDASPQHIGPVRSLRPYYIDFAAPFQASIVHVGGSPDALSRVRNGGYRDLDQFFNSGYFHRVNYRDAPHNVYTSFDRLDALNKAKGYTSSSFTIWPRKADKKLVTPTAKTINVQISSPDYYSHYDYDAATNTYSRSEGGAPHMELVSATDKTGVRIHPKVVIALVMAYSIAADGQHSVYADSGSGTAFVFQDGEVIQGTWSKANSGSQIQFSDSAGAPLKLNAGQTWLTLVAAANKVSYAP
ncbi:DUF3048 domain-containing protein [Candidatus Saccharibacteria bacterium]|nr:DUF3048 domain-containing protein [Candidatus Saccharibacteria bacterium]